MVGQQVPSLKEMDDQQAHRFLRELLSRLSPSMTPDMLS
jgi:hypothetical protein